MNKCSLQSSNFTKNGKVDVTIAVVTSGKNYFKDKQKTPGPSVGTKFKSNITPFYLVPQPHSRHV